MGMMHCMIGAVPPHGNPLQAQAGEKAFVRVAIVARMPVVRVREHESCNA